MVRDTALGDSAHSDAAFFVAGGNLAPDARCYVERSADVDLYRALNEGQFCYVLDTRQIGKSSLMVRAAARLARDGVRVAVLDLTGIGQHVTPAQWYGGLLAQLGVALSSMDSAIEDDLDDLWDEKARLGPAQRFFAGVELAASRGQSALVLFVDEIDAVRSLSFATDEFFAGVRACHARRAEGGALSRVTFCLLGSATPDSLVRDVRTTPFNIGRRIEPSDFTAIEAAPLAQGLGPSGVSLLERVLYWTGGHPYLTQRLCREVAEVQVGMVNAAMVDRIAARTFFTDAARESEPNLTFVAARLLRGGDDVAALLDLYLRIRRRPRRDEPDSPLAAALRLSGLVRASGGVLRVRNRLYERVFDAAWVRRSLPDAERRRQRSAFYRGLLLTAAASSALVVVTGGFALDGFRARRDAAENLRRYNGQIEHNKAQLDDLIRYKLEADQRLKELGDQSAKSALTEFQLRRDLENARAEIERLKAPRQ